MTFVLVPYPEYPWELPLDLLFDADQHVKCREICARNYFLIEPTDSEPLEAPRP